MSDASKRVAEALREFTNLTPWMTHHTQCSCYRQAGRFGKREGMLWKREDEQACDCMVGLALRRAQLALEEFRLEEAKRRLENNP